MEETWRRARSVVAAADELPGMLEAELAHPRCRSLARGHPKESAPYVVITQARRLRYKTPEHSRWLPPFSLAQCESRVHEACNSADHDRSLGR